MLCSYYVPLICEIGCGQVVVSWKQRGCVAYIRATQTRVPIGFAIRHCRARNAHRYRWGPANISAKAAIQLQRGMLRNLYPLGATGHIRGFPSSMAFVASMLSMTASYCLL